MTLIGEYLGACSLGRSRVIGIVSYAATDLLRDTSLPVTLIAQNVGYTSEAAFSRAFKNRYGTPPAHWRRDTRAKHS